MRSPAPRSARRGADTYLIAGPTGEPDPPGVHVRHVETAEQMLTACREFPPADIAVCAAAVADWKVAAQAAQKIKKGSAPPKLELALNPDILATLSQAGNARPALVVGFAAETERVVEQAKKKLQAKRCDWIVANDVSPGTGTFGGGTIRRISSSAAASRTGLKLSKREVADPAGPSVLLRHPPRRASAMTAHRSHSARGTTARAFPAAYAMPRGVVTARSTRSANRAWRRRAGRHGTPHRPAPAAMSAGATRSGLALRAGATVLNSRVPSRATIAARSA